MHTLVLRGNNIGARGIKVLSQVLIQDSKLEVLDLYDNSLGNQATRALLESLRINRSLKVLNLWYNRLNVEISPYLASMIKFNCGLTKLLIGGNDMGDEVCKAILDALKLNVKLMELDLAGNTMSASLATSISNCLKENAFAEKLRISALENGISYYQVPQQQHHHHTPSSSSHHSIQKSGYSQTLTLGGGRTSRSPPKHNSHTLNITAMSSEDVRQGTWCVLRMESLSSSPSMQDLSVSPSIDENNHANHIDDGDAPLSIDDIDLEGEENASSKDAYSTEGKGGRDSSEEFSRYTGGSGSDKAPSRLTNSFSSWDRPSNHKASQTRSRILPGVIRMHSEAITRLSLFKLGLTEVPIEPGQLPALTHLDLRVNRITSIPAEVLPNLPLLRSLLLSHNLLETLPDSIVLLSNLEHWSIHANPLTLIPKIYVEASLFSQPISQSPESVNKYDQNFQNYQNPQKSALWRYLASIRLGGSQEIKLQKAKVMIVGDANVGKTSLLHCLQTNFNSRIARWSHKLPKPLATDGIDIEAVKLKLPPVTSNAPPKASSAAIAAAQISQQNAMLSSSLPSMPHMHTSSQSSYQPDTPANTIDYPLPTEAGSSTNSGQTDQNSLPSSEASSSSKETATTKNVDINHPSISSSPSEPSSSYSPPAIAPENSFHQQETIPMSSRGSQSLPPELTPSNSGAPSHYQQQYHNVATSPTSSSAATAINYDVWDFAGQDVYYTTHSFFLTPNTIYLVVFDLSRTDSEQMSRIDYWIQSIQTRAGTSLSYILLVGTHTDEAKVETSYRIVSKLARRWVVSKDVLELCTVSCKSGAGIEALKSTLNATATKFGLASQLFPKAWLQIGDVIKGLMVTQPWISMDKLKEIARQFYVTPTTLDLAVLPALKDIGVVLHFPSDAQLQDTVFINAQFIIKAFADVLTIKHRGFIKSDGILLSRDLHHLWQGERRHFSDSSLMKLFQLFDVAIRLDSERLLVPALLMDDAPPNLEDYWPHGLSEGEDLCSETDRMLFRRCWTFKFLPLGFFSKIIAQCYRNMNWEVNCHWKGGIVCRNLDGELALATFNELTFVLLLRIDGHRYSSILTHFVLLIDTLVKGWYPNAEFTNTIPVPNERATRFIHISKEDVIDAVRLSSDTKAIISTPEEIETIEKSQHQKSSLEASQHHQDISHQVILQPTTSRSPQVGTPSSEPPSSSVTPSSFGNSWKGEYRVDLLAPDLALAGLTQISLEELDTALVSGPMIGKGGQGRVLQGTFHGRPVAIKHFEVLNLAHEDDFETQQEWLSYKRALTQRAQLTLQHETLILKNARHPNIVRLVGFNIHRLIVILEFISHGHLEAYLRAGESENGESNQAEISSLSTSLQNSNIERNDMVSDSKSPLEQHELKLNPTSSLHTLKEALENPALQLRIALDIASALSYLHQLKPAILHRDLAANNIMLESLDVNAPVVAKLVDFGTASFVGKIGLGMYNNEKSYCLAPEVLKGRDHSHKSDVYSFAIILWQMMCSKFSHELSVNDIVVRGERPAIDIPCRSGWRDIESRNPSAVNAYKEIISKSWDLSPETRPEFVELISSLVQIAIDIGVDEKIVLPYRLHIDHGVAIENEFLEYEIPSSAHSAASVQDEEHEFPSLWKDSTVYSLPQQSNQCSGEYSFQNENWFVLDGVVGATTLAATSKIQKPQEDFISTLLWYEEHLYVGTRDGTVVKLEKTSLAIPSDLRSSSTQISGAVSVKISKEPILQFIPWNNEIMLCLTDTTVEVFDKLENQRHSSSLSAVVPSSESSSTSFTEENRPLERSASASSNDIMANHSSNPDSSLESCSFLAPTVAIGFQQADIVLIGTAVGILHVWSVGYMNRVAGIHLPAIERIVGIHLIRAEEIDEESKPFGEKRDEKNITDEKEKKEEKFEKENDQFLGEREDIGVPKVKYVNCDGSNSTTDSWCLVICQSTMYILDGNFEMVEVSFDDPSRDVLKRERISTSYIDHDVCWIGCESGSVYGFAITAISSSDFLCVSFNLLCSLKWHAKRVISIHSAIYDPTGEKQMLSSCEGTFVWWDKKSFVALEKPTRFRGRPPCSQLVVASKTSIYTFSRRSGDLIRWSLPNTTVPAKTVKTLLTD